MERECVAHTKASGPRDPTTLPFSAAQAMVDTIWSDMGLRYPPAVTSLSRQARSTIARADRLSMGPRHGVCWCASRSAAILYGKDPHFRLISA